VERRDLDLVEYINNFHYEESESPLLGSLLLDRVVEANNLLG
jgi:hypothetical protein